MNGVWLSPSSSAPKAKCEPPKETDVTDQEKQKAEELISKLEMSVGAIFPRDSANASLIAGMLQSLNGLRSVLGLIRPH